MLSAYKTLLPWRVVGGILLGLANSSFKIVEAAVNVNKLLGNILPSIWASLKKVFDTMLTYQAGKKEPVFTRK